jgi:hypothetical protein
MKVFFTKAGLRLPKRREKKTFIFYAGRAAELIDLHLMQKDDLAKSEKFRIQTHLAKFFIILP